MSTGDQVFVFEQLHELYARAAALRPNERLRARHRGQTAHGALLTIRRDPRFKGFSTFAPRQTRPDEPVDPTVFTIAKA